MSLVFSFGLERDNLAQKVDFQNKMNNTFFATNWARYLKQTLQKDVLGKYWFNRTRIVEK